MQFLFELLTSWTVLSRILEEVLRGGGRFEGSGPSGWGLWGAAGVVFLRRWSVSLCSSGALLFSDVGKRYKLRCSVFHDLST